MKVLITSDFYSEYELYETENINGLKNYAALMVLNTPDLELDENKYKLIGNQDTMTTEEAIKQADEIIYIDEIAANMGL